MRGLSSHVSLMTAIGPEFGRSASTPPTQEGTTVAKNKNQSRQRDQSDQRPGQRAGQGTESQDNTRASTTEEHAMPASTQAPRKQKQRFGHN
ncbi:hypothetical protein GA0115240_110818 [Streptomyces sp. DvalAA-14]|nr:hypothetical protein GA0115240_110818 [Streptomyces sp. DvalAA-14]